MNFSFCISEYLILNCVLQDLNGRSIRVSLAESRPRRDF